MNTLSRFTHAAAMGLAIVALPLAGCDKSDTTVPDVTAVTVDDDLARALSTELAGDSGGLVDQLGDVFAAADDMTLADVNRSAGGSPPADAPGVPSTRSAVYDENTGTWTVTIDRERGTPDGPYYATFQRVYEIQFLNPDGQPQQWYDTDGTIAATIRFTILSGSGSHHTPHAQHELTSLTGAFVATNTDTDIITVNGAYARAGNTVLTTRNAERTVDYTLDVTLTDVMGPRGVREHPCEALSGTVEGTYHADITFTRGNLYSEQTVDRDIVIELGDCEGHVRIDDHPYRVDLRNGDLR